MDGDIMSNDKKEEFTRLSNKLIKFLNDNYHPHAHIIITTMSAEIAEGVMVFENKEFIKG